MINCKITDDCIKLFEKNGFLIKENFIEKNFISLLISKFEPIFRGEFETGIAPDEWNWVYGESDPLLTRQICNAWKSDRLIRNLVCHQKMSSFGALC